MPIKPPARPPETRSSALWRARLDEWSTSGLSAAAFASRNGFNVHSLYAWRKRLRAAPPQSPPQLVPVALDVPVLCEIQFPSGIVFRFPSSMPVDSLRDLVRALVTA